MRIEDIKHLHIEGRYGIWAIRLAVLAFLVINFHWLNAHPLFNFDLINIAEFFYLVFIVLLLILSRYRKLPFKARYPKLIVDFSFAAAFELLSLSKGFPHSGLYVLYLIPIIYCSYWLSKTLTFIFVTFVSIVYSISNYFFLEMASNFGSFREIVKALGPTVVVFYIAAIGTVYYQNKVQINYRDIDRRVKEKTAALRREKDYTRNLLKSAFDAIIAVDAYGQITEVNERARELLKYENEEELKKRNAKYLYAKGEARRIMNELRESDNGSLENFDAYILGKNGEEIPIQLSVTFLHDRTLDLKAELSKGKRFPSVGYFRDIRVERAVEYISEKVTSTTDEKALLDKIVKIVTKTLNAETCSVLTYNESSGLLGVASTYGMPEELKRGKRVESYRDEKDGMTAKVFFSNQPLNISDIDVKKKHPKEINIKWKYARRFAEHSKFKDFKHFLGIPLVVQGEVYGVIRVLNKYFRENKLDKYGFTDNDRRVLERIAGQVSILVEKVRDKERFEAISKVGRKLNEMLDKPLDDLLKFIAEGVVVGMQFKACYLRLIDESDNLIIKACHGLKGDYEEERRYALKVGKGISGEVAKTGEMRVVEDLKNEEGFGFKHIVKREELGAMLSIPLEYRSKVIGVINCYTHRVHKFTEQEIQSMKIFAAYASTAIQNKKRIDELCALSDIGSELVKPIKIDELFDHILKNAKKISGADSLCIKTYDKRSGRIETVSALDCKWYKKHRGNVFNIGEGIEGDVVKEVIKTGESRIISTDDEMRERLKEQPDKHLLDVYKSSALVPIRIDNTVFGLLFFESNKYDFFKEEDFLILNAFSIQAAIALRNANFFDKFQRVTGTFPRISELNVDIEKVLENIAKIAAEVLETDIFVLYRYDEKKDEIIWPPIVNGAVEFPQYMVREVDEFDAPLSFIKRGEDHYAVKSLDDPIMVPSEEAREGIPKRFVIREKIASSAGVLLKVGGEIVGIMFINYRTPHNFDDDERKIIENYASYIAIAIQNVRHYREKEISSSMQTLVSLAATVAHNIKNDIGTINLYTGDLLDGTNEDAPHYFNLIKIKERIHKIAGDIDFLVNASRLKNPKKRPVSIKDFINEIEKEIKPELDAKAIELEIKLTYNLPDIEIDSNQIKMVFSNLVQNSIHAMPDGGKIFISVSRLKRAVLLSWKDTGTGIPPENALKVFQPFWTTKGKGFGLGLFLSKSIIEEHGGSISLDMKCKKGTNFNIKFPVKKRFWWLLGGDND